MIVMTPEYVPCDNAEPFAETVMVDPAMVALSQLAPFNMDAVAPTVAPAGMPDGDAVSVIIGRGASDRETAVVEDRALAIPTVVLFERGLLFGEHDFVGRPEDGSGHTPWSSARAPLPGALSPSGESTCLPLPRGRSAQRRVVCRIVSPALP